MDYFNIDSVLELIDKSKRKLIDEMDTITFDNDKLSKESDKLLRILEYSPRKRHLERDIIKTLPIIKLKPPSEPKIVKNAKTSKHSKLPSTPNIDSFANQNKEANQENKDIIKDILNVIIDNSVEKSENKEKKEEEKKEEEDEDDDDDYYEKLMAQRQKQIEEREKKMQREDDDDFGIKKHKATKSQDIANLGQPRGNRGISYTSRLSTAMNLLSKLKVYLFNTNKNFDINISPSDTVKSVKSQIIKFLVDKKYELKYTSENAYEIRLIEDDDTKPNMDYPPLENNSLMFMVKPKAIAFLENPNYNPSQDYSSEKILGNVKKSKSTRSGFYDKENDKKKPNENKSINEEDEINPTEKMNIKVYYKANGINSSKIVSLSSEDNLKGILKIFFNQDILQYKNFDFYYFVEYKSAQELDNAINLETNIKYLHSYELSLCYKNFPDLPEAMNAYNKGMMLNTDDKKISKNEKDDDGVSGGRDFFFNEISAGLYQEFEVVKINKFKSQKERILGIDMYHLYNNMPKKRSSGIMNFIFKETKKPRRKMKNVKACSVIGDKSFYIDIKDEVSEQVKRACYEVKNNLIRDEIVAKINFLIKLNQENSN